MTPRNAGQTLTVSQVSKMPVTDVDWGEITIRENWGRLFVEWRGKQIVLHGPHYEKFVAAILHFVPTDGLVDKLKMSARIWARAAEADVAPTFSRGDAREWSERFSTAAALINSQRDEAPTGSAVVVEYTNYRGETALRTVVPIRLWWGSTEWHPDEQWILTAWDTEKEAQRDFAWRDMRPAGTAEFVARADDRAETLVKELVLVGSSLTAAHAETAELRAKVARLEDEMRWALPILKRHLTHPNDSGDLSDFEAAINEGGSSD